VRVTWSLMRMRCCSRLWRCLCRCAAAAAARKEEANS
jgi:hypothetical protein